MSNNGINLDCKLRAIVTLGDICLPAEEKILPYIGGIMESLTQACGQSLQVGDDEDDQ